MKLVVDQESQRILGCHIVGPDSPEMIQMGAIAIKMGVTKAQWDATCAVHPTAAEELVTMREKYVPLEPSGVGGLVPQTRSSARSGDSRLSPRGASERPVPLWNANNANASRTGAFSSIRSRMFAWFAFPVERLTALREFYWQKNAGSLFAARRRKFGGLRNHISILLIIPAWPRSKSSGPWAIQRGEGGSAERPDRGRCCSVAELPARGCADLAAGGLAAASGGVEGGGAGGGAARGGARSSTASSRPACAPLIDWLGRYRAFLADPDRAAERACSRRWTKRGEDALVFGVDLEVPCRRRSSACAQRAQETARGLAGRARGGRAAEVAGERAGERLDLIWPTREGDSLVSFEGSTPTDDGSHLDDHAQGARHAAKLEFRPRIKRPALVSGFGGWRMAA